MISLLIKTYLYLLLPIAIGSLLLFIAGLFFIFTIKPKPALQSSPLSDEDLSSIAGDDRFATQLDLALAYIETDKKHLAKDMLDIILQQGNASEQAEARRLMSHL